MYMYFVKSDRMCELIFSSSPVKVYHPGELDCIQKCLIYENVRFRGKVVDVRLKLYFALNLF